jgi:hypothetical protein
LVRIVEIFIDTNTSQTLKVVRAVFRPLKIFNAMQSLKDLLKSLIAVLPHFVNVGAFMIFVFTLFATMGVQQYEGAIYN